MSVIHSRLLGCFCTAFRLQFHSPAYIARWEKILIIFILAQYHITPSRINKVICYPHFEALEGSLNVTHNPRKLLSCFALRAVTGYMSGFNSSIPNIIRGFGTVFHSFLFKYHCSMLFKIIGNGFGASQLAGLCLS